MGAILKAHREGRGRGKSLRAWLEAQASGVLFPGFKPGLPPDNGELAIRGWNLMNGKIDWSALDFLVVKFGIEDVDIFVSQLVAIQDHQTEMAKHHG